MADAAPRPDDLEQLLADLQRARADTVTPALLALLPRLRAMARRHLPQQSPLRVGIDSEDLAQEGILQLVRNVDRFRGATWPEFLAFVHAILAQKKGQAVRRHAVRRGEFSPTVDSARLAAQQPSPSVDAMAAEDRRRLRALVAALPEPYRTALKLRLDGHDNQVIAARLGIGADAARQRLSRAVRLLQEQW